MTLVGNKTDLQSARAVTTERGKSYAEEQGVSFLEASALNGGNVEAAFVHLLTDIFRKKVHAEHAKGL